MSKEITLSDNQKIQYIHSIPAVKVKWAYSDLTKEERRFVLDAMEIGLDQNWILAAIEDARVIREEVTANA